MELPSAHWRTGKRALRYFSPSQTHRGGSAPPAKSVYSQSRQCRFKHLLVQPLEQGDGCFLVVTRVKLACACKGLSSRQFGQYPDGSLPFGGIELVMFMNSIYPDDIKLSYIVEIVYSGDIHQSR